MEQTENLNKSFEASKEAISPKEADIPSETAFKRHLSRDSLSGSDLKLYLLFKFGTYNRASKIAGISTDRIHQICSGYFPPENPDLIKKLAEAWDVDIVVLTKLFERLR